MGVNRGEQSVVELIGRDERRKQIAEGGGIHKH